MEFAYIAGMWLFFGLLVELAMGCDKLRGPK